MSLVLYILLFVALAPFTAWIVGLWALAIRSLAPRPPAPTVDATPRFAIIVPAHNEGEVISETVKSILACDYPRERFRLYVIADNCTDNTAELAEKAGAEVLRRQDAVNRGKGHALAYALEAIKNEPCDAVLFMDADSTPNPDYLRVMANYRVRGDVMIQGRYDIDQPDRNWFTRLTSISFVLRNRWLFPACDALGLTLPLRGSGMCFDSRLIFRLGWESHGLNEDMEMTLRLIKEKIRVTFAPQAVSRQFMPATPAMAATQRQRWSAGEHNLRRILIKQEIPGALRRRDWLGAVSLVLMAMPPFSLQLCVALLLLPPSCYAGGLVWVLSLLALGLYAGYFLLGVERLDRQGIAAVFMLPVFAVWRVGIYIMARFKTPTAWIRTPRKDKGAES